MIPLIILTLTLAATLGGGIYLKVQKDSAKAHATKAEEAADILATAKEKGNIYAYAAPGLEAETRYLTDHIGAFEHIAEPVQDLYYAKKLTGEIPAMAKPPEEATPPEVAAAQEQAEIKQLWQSTHESTPWPGFYSGVNPETAAETLAGQGKAGVLQLVLAHTPGIIAEAASLGQMESIMWTIMHLTNASGLPDIVKNSNILPYEIAVLGPARYHYNQIYRPMQPELRDLPRMLARGQITAEEYFNQAAYEGFDGRWAAAQWNIFLRLPEFRELSIMRWRGLIDDTGFKDIMLRLGWHGDVVDEMLNLAWQIPGPDDLIRFVVREVIPPAEFITQMGKQGYGPGWSSAYWDAHFRLPSPGDLIEAFHRGFISEAELRKYIFWHDYSPDPRPDIAVSDIDIYKSLTKTLIPRVDIRRAYLYGVLPFEDLERRYRWLGYEEDSPLMAGIAARFALESYYGQIETQARALYKEGLMSEEEFRGWLRKKGLPEEAIDLAMDAEKLRWRLDYIRDLIAAAVQAYRSDIYTAEDLEAYLVSLGMDLERVKPLVAKEIFKKVPKQGFKSPS